MAAGAEGEARVQHQRHPALGKEPLDLFILLEPLGNHQQPLSDLHGLIILLPVVFPVGVLDGVHGQKKAAAVVPLGLEILQGQAHQGHLGKACLSGLQIKGNAGAAPHGRLQILVHIVPVLAVVFQKVVEFRLVVNDHAVDAQGGEEGLHRLQSGVGGVDVQFQPVHNQAPCSRSARGAEKMARRKAPGGKDTRRPEGAPSGRAG